MAPDTDRTAKDSIPCISIGTARLPKSIADGSGMLTIELSLDRATNRILDIASTLALPNYTAVLRRLFVGSHPDEMESAAQRLVGHLRGPLLRPTAAALAQAAANFTAEAEDQ